MSTLERATSAFRRSSIGQALRDAKNDELPTLGKSIAFSVLVAFFPGCVALISLYGSFADPEDVTRLLQRGAEVLPRPMESMLSNQVVELTTASPATLGVGAALGIATSLWAVSSALDSIVRAIDTAYEVTEGRGIVRARLVALSISVATLVGAGLVTFLMTRLPNIFWLRTMVACAGALCWLMVLYRYAPNRARPSWRHVVPGATLAFFVGLVATWLIGWYIANFTSYNRTYGVLGGAVVALLWLHANAVILLVGAELNAVIETRHGGLEENSTQRPSHADS